LLADDLTYLEALIVNSESGEISTEHLDVSHQAKKKKLDHGDKAKKVAQGKSDHLQVANMSCISAEQEFQHCHTKSPRKQQTSTKVITNPSRNLLFQSDEVRPISSNEFKKAERMCTCYLCIAVRRGKQICLSVSYVIIIKFLASLSLL